MKINRQFGLRKNKAKCRNDKNQCKPLCRKGL
jgi:hypothetical protein